MRRTLLGLAVFFGLAFGLFGLPKSPFHATYVAFFNLKGSPQLVARAEEKIEVIPDATDTVVPLIPTATMTSTPEPTATATAEEVGMGGADLSLADEVTVTPEPSVTPDVGYGGGQDTSAVDTANTPQPGAIHANDPETGCPGDVSVEIAGPHEIDQRLLESLVIMKPPSGQGWTKIPVCGKAGDQLYFIGYLTQGDRDPNGGFYSMILKLTEPAKSYGREWNQFTFVFDGHSGNLMSGQVDTVP